MPAPHAPKKAATTATTTTTPTPPADPLAAVQTKLNEAKAAEQAAHLACYRAAVNALAAGKSIAPEEEGPLAAALKFFELDTDTLKRDVHALQSVEGMKKSIGATVEERAANCDAISARLKPSAANLDKLRDQLKRAEDEHYGIVREENAFAQVRSALERLIMTNPRIFGVWPPPPKVDTDPGRDSNSLGSLNNNNFLHQHQKPAPVEPTCVVHPITQKPVLLTPELRAKLQKEEPAVWRNLCERATYEAAQNPTPEKKEPVSYFDATKIAD